MEARFNLGDVVVALSADYLVQQTCSSSVFENVPRGMVELKALIEANQQNRDIRWYRMGENQDYLHISIPTELIVWSE